MLHKSLLKSGDAHLLGADKEWISSYNGESHPKNLSEKAGYDTYMTGKWHVKAAAEKSFDVTSHVRGGMPKDTKEGYNRPIEGKEDPWSPSDKKFGGFWEGGKHWSEVVADDALTFIDQSAQAKVWNIEAYSDTDYHR